MQGADPREHGGSEAAAPSSEDDETKQQQKWQRIHCRSVKPRIEIETTRVETSCKRDAAKDILP